jgi:hypothetical protein
MYGVYRIYTHIGFWPSLTIRLACITLLTSQGPIPANYAKMHLPPKPPKHDDLYHKVLAYDLPPGEHKIAGSLSTNCLNHSAEEV